MRLIDRLVALLTGGKHPKRPPDGLASFNAFSTAEDDKVNIQVEVEFPAPGKNQRPLAYASVEMRVVAPSADPPWSEVARVPVGPGTATRLLEDVASGDYELRGRAVDDAGAKGPYSPAVIVSVSFQDPSPLVRFAAAVAP